jgi:phosphoglycolate phosphatase-like HAD superfamily hydrolase
LHELVQAVYGVDTPGSKAQKIALARDRLLAGEPSAVFMIGDSLSDIRAAQEAAVTSIAVTWGHQRLEHLLRGGPDHVVTLPQQLLAIIGP